VYVPLPLFKKACWSHFQNGRGMTVFAGLENEVRGPILSFEWSLILIVASEDSK
jgi:hypothetical protein